MYRCNYGAHVYVRGKIYTHHACMCMPLYMYIEKEKETCQLLLLLPIVVNILVPPKVHTFGYKLGSIRVQSPRECNQTLNNIQISYHMLLIPKEIKLTIYKNLLALANTKILCKNKLNYCLAPTKTRPSFLDFTNYSLARASLICKIKQKSKYETCLDKIKPKTFICKEKHKQQIWWFQNSENFILITQILTYPKHEKFGTMFIMEYVPNLFTLSYLY